MNYQNKYLKYKNKYLELKKNIKKGGECNPLPDMSDEEMITLETFGSRTPNDRITIDGACYFVRELYDLIMIQNHKAVPHTNIDITPDNEAKLIAAYNKLLAPVELPVEPVAPEEPKQYDNIKNIKKKFPDNTNIFNKYEYNY
jgi:hypothetical protein